MTRTTKHPMTRGEHYRQADKLLSAYDGEPVYDNDTPELLRALIHAVLATTAGGVYVDAEFGQ